MRTVPGRSRFLDWNSHVALLLTLGDKSLIESRHRLREYRITADPTLHLSDLVTTFLSIYIRQF